MRKLLLIMIPFYLVFADVNIPDNKCALIVKNTYSLKRAKEFIDDLDYKMKLNANIYKKGNGEYAISVGFLKDKNKYKIMNLWKKQGKIPLNSKCLKSNDFKEEEVYFKLIIMQSKGKFGFINGPSFNCKYANKDSEYKICNDSILQDLDIMNFYLYKTLYNSFRKRYYKKLLEEHESEWLIKRDNCGSNYECLRDIYLSNINFFLKKLKTKENHYMSENDTFEKKSYNFDSKPIKVYKKPQNITGNCKFYAFAYCVAVKYGCSKFSENVPDNEKYAYSIGCGMFANSYINSEYTTDDAIISASNTALKNYAKNHDDIFSLFASIASFTLTINSFARCQIKAERYFCNEY